MSELLDLIWLSTPFRIWIGYYRLRKKCPFCLKVKMHLFDCPAPENILKMSEKQMKDWYWSNREEILNWARRNKE